MAKTNAERQRDLRAHKRTIRGLVLKQVWVIPSKWEAIQKAIARIQKQPQGDGK